MRKTQRKHGSSDLSALSYGSVGLGWPVADGLRWFMKLFCCIQVHTQFYDCGKQQIKQGLTRDGLVICCQCEQKYQDHKNWRSQSSECRWCIQN